MPIDLAVGLVLQAKLGDPIVRGQPLAIVHANDEERLLHAERVLQSALELSASPVAPPPVILERLGTSAASVA